MSSSEELFDVGDTVTAGITEPVVINGREHFLKFSVSATVNDPSEDPHRVVAATLHGLSDLINETITARTRTNERKQK